MKKSLVLIFVLIVSVCLHNTTISKAAANTYYVAVNGSNSTGNGSSSSPWATIEYALSEVADDSLILVGPGTYSGRIRLDQDFSTGVTIRSEPLYQAKLRHTGTVITCYYGRGITLEGFDIAHSGPGAGALVIQIQDLIGDPGGSETVSRITLRNNIIHDSYDNDLLKINNGASQITVEGNMFYNQSGSDEHIDINSVTDVIVQDNVFFNDFEGSGRVNNNDTSSYIVIKDSNGSDDSNLGSQNITVRRNIFFNWQGSSGTNFVLIGEDGNPYFEAINVMVENNLMLGNSANVIRAAFGVKGGKDITFRNNTIVGDLPALAYAMRLNTEGDNPANENIRFYNNIWADPTGTMGAENASRPNDFSDTPIGETTSFTLNNNLYWNGGASIPSDSNELVNYSNDSAAYFSNPYLPTNSSLTLPRWNPTNNLFADGSSSIRQVFVRLVNYGRPGLDSPAINHANPSQSPTEDILGYPRPVGGVPDLGAVEVPPLGDERLYLPLITR